MTLIEQIHQEVDTAQDRLLMEAKRIIEQTNLNTQTPIESIGERLRRVGFLNTPTAKKADVLKGAKEVVKKKLVESEEQAKLIQYYMDAYPFLKFMTESELDRICVKYKLVYAPIANYVKDVPEKNLRDIETAQPLMLNDFPLNSYTVKIHRFSSGNDELKKFLNGRDIPYVKSYPGETEPRDSQLERCAKKMGYTGSFGRWVFIEATLTEIDKRGLFIAAPNSHFNKDGLRKKGLGFFSVFETELKDPIVFRYVKGGIQVLTKWGEEANDPSLVVPKLN